MRKASIAVLSLLAGAAFAQASMSPAERDRQFKAERETELSLSRWLSSQRARPLTDADRAVQAVHEAVARGDCVAAAASLNAGLAKAYPAVWMLAGAMYEDGVCLKANWDRALAFYQRADTAGHPGAAARVAAGYAASIGGRDLAASLWWALRARTELPAPCAEVAPLAQDADRFIAALQAWPAGQLGACAYAGAVMSAVQGELAAPDLALGYGLEGTLKLTFVPAQARLDIDSEGLVAAATVQDALTRDADQRSARDALAQQLRRAADRTLKRHDKPAGVPAAWRVETAHVLKRPL